MLNLTSTRNARIHVVIDEIYDQHPEPEIQKALLAKLWEPTYNADYLIRYLQDALKRQRVLGYFTYAVAIFLAGALLWAALDLASGIAVLVFGGLLASLSLGFVCYYRGYRTIESDLGQIAPIENNPSPHRLISKNSPVDGKTIRLSAASLVRADSVETVRAWLAEFSVPELTRLQEFLLETGSGYTIQKSEADYLFLSHSLGEKTVSRLRHRVSGQYITKITSHGLRRGFYPPEIGLTAQDLQFLCKIFTVH